MMMVEEVKIDATAMNVGYMGSVVVAITVIAVV
jgi:hypothetical protein